MLIFRRTGRARIRLAPIALFTAVTFLTPAAAHSASAGASGLGTAGVAPTAVGTPVTGFDAVGTQAERHGWKHLGLRKDRYIVFDDGGVFETGLIRVKWPFLSADFVTNVDAASIAFSGSKWKYTFVKGGSAIIFFDSGIVAGPVAYTALWPFLGPALSSGLDALTDHTESGLSVHMVTSGTNFMIFRDTANILAQGQIGQRWPFLPSFFQSGNLDDASIEPENGGWKISFYKGNDRIVFQDTGQIYEDLPLTQKWRFLNSFLNS